MALGVRARRAFWDRRAVYSIDESNNRWFRCGEPIFMYILLSDVSMFPPDLSF